MLIDWMKVPNTFYAHSPLISIESLFLSLELLKIHLVHSILKYKVWPNNYNKIWIFFYSQVMDTPFPDKITKIVSGKHNKTLTITKTNW